MRLSEDLQLLSFRVVDKKGRAHCMEIQLDKNYPRSPPSISALLLEATVYVCESLLLMRCVSYLLSYPASGEASGNLEYFG